MLDFFHNLLAAISVVLNGLPQGLLAISYGFASFPTALGFITGAVACGVLGSVIPISFQSETIILAGDIGKDKRERTSIILFAGLIMVILGLTGTLTTIVDFAGDRIIAGMMAGVGLMLSRIAFQAIGTNPLVALTSIATAILTYVLSDRNLIYTVVVSVVISSIVSHIFDKNNQDHLEDPVNKLKIQKPVINYNVIRGALAIACLTIGANIAFGNITADIANVSSANIDHLTIYSGLADSISALFGGGPVEAIISATAAAPAPVLAAIMMMSIMAIILLLRLLPKIGKYVPNNSITGFVFIIGAVVTVPANAAAAFANAEGDQILVGGVTMAVTAGLDPFIGLVAGLVVRALIGG